MKAQDIIKETTYSINGFAKFSIFRINNTWSVAEQTFGYSCPFKLLDGSKAGGYFNSFESAEKEIQRIIDYYNTPLTTKTIRKHFEEKWIKREEESDLLREFKLAFLNQEFKKAGKLYQKMSNYTKEAIPNIVCYQICYKISRKI